jgi:hypothetical protein
MTDPKILWSYHRIDTMELRARDEDDEYPLFIRGVGTVWIKADAASELAFAILRDRMGITVTPQSED